MKKSLLFFAVFLVNFTFAQYAWERISPKPQENTVNEIFKIPGTDKIIAVCENATLMTSTDEGQTWEVQMNPGDLQNNIHLNDVDFANSQNGFIACENGMILKTTNGGNSWDSLQVSDFALRHIHAFSQNKIIASGMLGSIYMSENAGIDWQEIETEARVSINNMCFPTQDTGYMLDRYSAIFQSTDGGYSWDSLTHIDIGDPYLIFVDEEEGYLAGTNYQTGASTVLRTLDAGMEWDTVWQGPGYLPLFLSHSNNELILTTFQWYGDGHVFTSSDQGESWTDHELPLYYTYDAAVCVLNENKFIISGGFGTMVKTEDHFHTWTHLGESSNLGNVNDLQFIKGKMYAATTYFYAGTGVPSGDLFRSEDYGMTWNEVATGYPVESVFLLDENTGYYQDYYYIEKTTDGFESHFNFLDFFGANDEHPTGIYFLDENSGFIGLDRNNTGVIQKTTDGGNSWYDVFSEMDRIPGKFLFVNSEKGFAISKMGYQRAAILRTEDAGETWTSYDIQYAPFTTDIFFINEETGFVTTNFNGYYYTGNGGDQWDYIEIPWDIELNTVFFANDTVGYLAGKGSYHTILKTNNGGESWFPIEKPSTNPIFRMHFFDENNGIVFGRYGLVSKTETGGQVGQHEILTDENSFELQAYPNPFSDQIKLTFAPVFWENIDLSIYDIHGRLIRQVRLSNQNKYIWDGTDQLGKKVNGGVYVCRMSDGKRNAIKTLLLL